MRDEASRIKTYLKYKKYYKSRFRFGDGLIIIGIMALPIIPVTIFKNLYMDFWKFTLNLRDFYRCWFLFVINFLMFHN